MGKNKKKHRLPVTPTIPPEPKPQEHTKWPEKLFTILIAILSLVPTPMPVNCRLFLGLLAWLGLVDWACTDVAYLRKLSGEVKVLGFLLITNLFLISLMNPINLAWREEMASKTEGDLFGSGTPLSRYGGIPSVEIGNTGTFLMSMSGGPSADPLISLFPDSGITVEDGEGERPMISTIVRDSEGNIIATINKNHWNVDPAHCYDKNYTNTALEVLDRGGHVVLQVVLLPKGLPDKPGRHMDAPVIQLQGEWWDDQGRGVRISESPDGKHSRGTVLTSIDKKNDELIRPMFRYPSAHHWGELVR